MSSPLRFSPFLLFPRSTALLLALGLLVGCASTKVSDRDSYDGPKLPHPARIIVYDFAATPDDIPAWAEAGKAFAGTDSATSEEDLAEGRKLGADIAAKLIDEINDLGMKAVPAKGQPDPELNDIVIIGYFTSIDEGSATKRMLVGFGKGAASVGTHAEGYHMTETGLVLLGGGDVGSGGGKGPGLAVSALVTVATKNPVGLVVSGAIHAEGEISGRSGAKGSAERVAKEISKVLEEKFKEQGWI